MKTLKKPGARKHDARARTHYQPGRRDMLRLLAGAGVLPLLPLASCATDDALDLRDSDTPDGGSNPLDSSASDGASNAASDWASGGTKAATAKASYPNAFTAALSTCAIVASTTEGPCTTESDLSRQDVSDGWSGLPVRLALKVVDAACEPIAGATVKIWHTNLEGSYSGQTPNNNMCLKQQSYASQNFFRGVQKTSADGTVFFDTCFPGWYRGRAVHIHFQVKTDTTTYRISQLFFPEEITQEIFASHSEYSSAGQPDTTFANDNIMARIPTGERDRHILTVARMSDGAMLASKVVNVVA